MGSMKQFDIHGSPHFSYFMVKISEQGDPEKGHNLPISGQDTASGALGPVFLPQHHTGF